MPAAMQGDPLVAAILSPPSRYVAVDQLHTRPSLSMGNCRSFPSFAIPPAFAFPHTRQKRDSEEHSSFPAFRRSPHVVFSYLSGQHVPAPEIMVPQHPLSCYESELPDRLGSGFPIHNQSSRLELLVGAAAIQLYRFTSWHDRRCIYKSGHTVYRCPLILIAETHFSEISPVTKSLKADR